ncbi:MAG: Ig-like domain-containing protein [Calditrichota bacterium]
MSIWLKWGGWFIAVFMLAGCEGDPGSPGVNRLPEDLQPPLVDLTFPQARKRVFDETMLEAHVFDDIRVDRVQFMVDSKWDSSAVLTTYEPPWNRVWDCRNLLDGPHFLQAVAWDHSGKAGYSSLVLVYKMPPDSIVSEDTIRFYDPSSMGDLSWRLPDNLSRFTGYGTRFSANRPGRLAKIYVRFLKLETWRGLELQFEIRSSNRGMPDSLISSFGFNGTRMRMDPGVTAIWYRVRPDEDVIVPTEYFILATKAEETTGDTLAIMSDEGIWRNWHGWVQENGSWREFTAGQKFAYNPLIYCIMEN